MRSFRPPRKAALTVLPQAVGAQWELPGAVARRDQGETLVSPRKDVPQFPVQPHGDPLRS
jgi:hypothetical protein